MNNRNAMFAGAALLVAGLFTPILTLPIVGSVNLFGNGTNLIAIDLLVIAIAAAALAAKDMSRNVFWLGIAASGVILYEFGTLQVRLTEMRDNLTKELQGNPFAGIAQGAMSAVQVQWGWLVLAAGAGLLVYAGISATREKDEARFALLSGTDRAVAAGAALLMLFAPAWDLFSRSGSSPTNPTTASATNVDTNVTGSAAATSSEAPSADEAAYIKQNLRLYDFRAKYFESMLDGRVPGIDFKIQNNGNRTLNKVTVRVVFFDASGNPISEEDYNPVIVSDYAIGDNTPLRPHYIWQQESDKFYEAKNVPSEWAEGKASATITDIEFGPTS
jgi:hypothetical protein